MSKVVEYVGLLHVLKDHAKETWTQLKASLSSSNSTDGEASTSNENEINFRSRIKEKLERLKQQSIRAINNSSNDQEDYSHLTRPKSRRELMQISAAVMGIEFSYAAETAFVSPLLLNIGLRHRHMTLIWCLSPLFGFFLTPILGSLSDGCKSQLGRRRPYILLLSIGIVLGLIMVPNGKTLGRMLGDTYSDDGEPVDLNTPTELTSHLLVPSDFRNPIDSSTAYKPNFSTVNQTDNATIGGLPLQSSFNASHYLNEDSTSQEQKLSYKMHSSKYNPTEEEHGFRAWNSLSRKDEDIEQQEFFKRLDQKDKSQKINQEELHQFLFQSSQDEDEGRNQENLGASEESKLEKDRVDQDGQDFGWNKRTSNETTSVSTSERMPQSKSLGRTNESATSQSQSGFDSGSENAVRSHPWGLVFTVIGTVLLDFDADACQSPSRAYMLDITIPEDHAKGLSTFTIMAGLGGSVGYFLGALNWENTFLGDMFGGQIRAVFTLVLFIFIACVIATVRSFREIPLHRLWANKSGETGLCGVASGTSELKPKSNTKLSKTYARLEDDGEASCLPANDEGLAGQKSYGTIQETSFNATPRIEDLPNKSNSSAEQAPTFREYVKTIVQLPHSLRWLCVTNFFCWMSLVCYSLYFTDFVGEAVFGGDPTAPRGSPLKQKYDEGVRFGCWGMSLYSLSCSVYSLCIETLVNRFGARRVYIYGQLVYSVGMVLMALARHPAGVIIFSWTAGIMYATLFTMPYLLVARYHAAETFDVDVDDMMKNSRR